MTAPEGSAIAAAPNWITDRAARARPRPPVPAALSAQALRLPDTVTSSGGGVGIIDLGADGLAVVAVAGTLNLALRTAAEQDSLVGQLAGWLHTLRQPVQILLRSARLDLTAYLSGLHTAAQRASREKRAKMLAVIDEMTARDELITFTGVARAASVSNWLVYAPGVREHIEQARQRQQTQPRLDRETGRTANTAGLKTDLAIARAEVARLRTERDQLKATVQRQLGQQLDQYAATDLITRVDELTDQNKVLIEELAAGRRANADLEIRLAEAQDDLAAARASLRRMIREESHRLPDAQ